VVDTIIIFLFIEVNPSYSKLIPFYVIQDTANSFADSKKYDLPGYAVSCCVILLQFLFCDS
jgi:hypothetical protein